jgi:hypothetical protein
LRRKKRGHRDGVRNGGPSHRPVAQMTKNSR